MSAYLRPTFAAIVFIASLLNGVVPAYGQNCANLGWVQAHGVGVNAGHVFCGELQNGNPRGFHSMALGPSAAQNLIAIPPTPANPVNVGNGIFNATVVFQAGQQKFSTFFPNACTYDAILTSISYAFQNQTGPHPVWGVIGPSAPGQNAAGYCLGTNGNPFDIRMGLVNANTSVNTAFPST